MMDVKRYPRESLREEKGMVLVVALLLIAVLLLLGTTAVMTSTTDMKISANYKTANMAFYAAEAGIAEAMKRLQGLSIESNYAGDPSATPALLWSAYILNYPASNPWQTSDDPNYSASYQNYIPTSASHTSTSITANSLQSSVTPVIPDFFYFVKIRHKTEYDAEQDGHTPVSSPHYYDNDGNTGSHTTAASPGNLIYWGYGNAATPTTAIQFTSSAATEFKPVEIITAYGKSGTAVRRIEAQVVRNPGPVIVSAIYAKGNITGNGTALTINGNDNCGVASAKPPTYTLDPSTTNPNGSPPMIPDPPGPTHGPLNIDVEAYVNSLKGSASVVITEDTSGDFGSLTNFVTVYSDTSNPYNNQGLKMENVNGYGILLVKGDLTLGGGFTWNGLVLCTGVLTFNGGGAGVNIRGAVIANETVTINGGLDIRYDSCMVDNALNNQTPQMITWREIY